MSKRQSSIKIKFNKKDGKKLARLIRTPSYTIVPQDEKERREVVGTQLVNNSSILIDWQTKGSGWGQLVIYNDGSGKAHAFTEYMSKEFCKKVLEHLVDNMVIDDGPMYNRTKG